jgi:hypothetical protein
MGRRAQLPAGQVTLGPIGQRRIPRPASRCRRTRGLDERLGTRPRFVGSPWGSSGPALAVRGRGGPRHQGALRRGDRRLPRRPGHGVRARGGAARLSRPEARAGARGRARALPRAAGAHAGALRGDAREGEGARPRAGRGGAQARPPVRDRRDHPGAARGGARRDRLAAGEDPRGAPPGAPGAAPGADAGAERAVRRAAGVRHGSDAKSSRASARSSYRITQTTTIA